MTHTLARASVVVFVLCCSLVPTRLEAGGPMGVVSKRAAQRLAAAASSRARSLLLRDRARDAATRVFRLPRSRTVFRYTSGKEAVREVRAGVVGKGRHFTARILPGRPLTAIHAQQRFGLARAPAARLTIRLPKGMPVRLNKTLGGSPGVGEITNTRALPPSAVRRVVRLRLSH